VRTGREKGRCGQKMEVQRCPRNGPTEGGLAGDLQIVVEPLVMDSENHTFRRHWQGIDWVVTE